MNTESHAVLSRFEQKQSKWQIQQLTLWTHYCTFNHIDFGE
jgi:hypothetical protein